MEDERYVTGDFWYSDILWTKDNRIDWSKYTTVSIHQLTGFEPFVLDIIWKKYCGAWTPIKTPDILLKMFAYYHLYPRQVDATLINSLGFSRPYIYNTLTPCYSYLASVIDEIHWEDRLSPYNHAYHFPYWFTTIVDTHPVVVRQPENGMLRSALYNPKYNACVYKAQVAVSFNGVIINYSGLHLGTQYDGHIWNETADSHPFLPEEMGLADGHYTACMQLLCPPKAPPNNAMTFENVVMYTLIAFYRARIEHINAYLKGHSIFRTPFRGNHYMLEHICKINAHASNIHLKLFPRYDLYRPWSHFDMEQPRI